MTTVRFKNIPIDEIFYYDGDTFVKTGEFLAWELRNNRRYKEWAFRKNDRCKIK